MPNMSKIYLKERLFDNTYAYLDTVRTKPEDFYAFINYCQLIGVVSGPRNFGEWGFGLTAIEAADTFNKIFEND